MIESVKVKENPLRVEVLDQRKLPEQEVVVTLRTIEEVRQAIETMLIRGAPVRDKRNYMSLD